MKQSEKKKYRLLSDIISGKGKLYGKKWHFVFEISDHGNVKIVEDTKGERFSVHESNLGTP